VWGYRLRNMKILCLKAPLMLALALYGVVAPVAARSWDDLDEGETEIYGREREEKLPLRLFFVQKEKWEGHEALHILSGFMVIPITPATAATACCPSITGCRAKPITATGS
jgi:hypothetical protein